MSPNIEKLYFDSEHESFVGRYNKLILKIGCSYLIPTHSSRIIVFNSEENSHFLLNLKQVECISDFLKEWSDLQ